MIEARIIIKIPTSLGFFKEPNFVKKEREEGRTLPDKLNNLS